MQGTDTVRARAPGRSRCPACPLPRDPLAACCASCPEKQAWTKGCCVCLNTGQNRRFFSSGICMLPPASMPDHRATAKRQNIRLVLRPSAQCRDLSFFCSGWILPGQPTPHPLPPHPHQSGELQQALTRTKQIRSQRWLTSSDAVHSARVIIVVQITSGRPA